MLLVLSLFVFKKNEKRISNEMKTLNKTKYIEEFLLYITKLQFSIIIIALVIAHEGIISHSTK